MDNFQIGYHVRAKHGLIWQFLKSRSLTQAKLSEMVGVDQNTISSIVNMKTIPELTVRARLAEITGHTIDDLFPEDYVQFVRTAHRKKAYTFTKYEEVAMDKLRASEELRAIPDVQSRAEVLIEYGEVKEELSKCLNPRLEQIFLMHTEGGQTLREIGNHFGLTTERVRQLYLTALRRAKIHFKGLEPSEVKVLHESKPKEIITSVAGTSKTPKKRKKRAKPKKLTERERDFVNSLLRATSKPPPKLSSYAEVEGMPEMVRMAYSMYRRDACSGLAGYNNFSGTLKNKCPKGDEVVRFPTAWKKILYYFGDGITFTNCVISTRKAVQICPC